MLSGPDLPSISVQLQTYDTITLRDFIAISSLGDYQRLVVNGQPSSEEVTNAWIAIVRQNAEANGDRSYDSYFQLLKSYTLLVAQYTIVKAELMQLSVVIDYDLVLDLRKRGYKISLNSTAELAKSIEAALKKVSNLVTKATMKQKEMEAMMANQPKSGKVGFEQLMANISTGLGFVVQDDITLARYNEYKRILKDKQSHQSKDYGKRHK